MPREAEEAWLCQVTGYAPSELRAMGAERIGYMLAWREGQTIAEWATEGRTMRDQPPRPREPAR